MKVSTAAPNKPASKAAKPSTTTDDDEDEAVIAAAKPAKPAKAAPETDEDTEAVAIDSEDNEQVSILAQKDLYPAPTIGGHSFPESGIKEFKRGKTYKVPAWTLPYLRDAKVAV